MKRPSRDRFTVEPWARTGPNARNDAVRDLADALRAALASDPDARTVEVVVNRSHAERLLAALGAAEDGAAIRDDTRAVTYYATAETTADGENLLRTVEIVPDRPLASTYEVRLPTRLLADLAAEEAAKASGAFTLDLSHPLTKPSARELGALVSQGWTRHSIADTFDRSLNTVDQWLRVARKEAPDAFPERTRGPAPQTTDGTPPPANRKEPK